MAVKRVSDSEALAVAASINFPDASILGTAGTKVVYNNKYYLLTIRDNIYVAWDISVYNSDGSLETDGMDVYWDIVKDLPEVVVQSVKDVGIGLGIVVALIAGLYIFILVKK